MIKAFSILIFLFIGAQSFGQNLPTVRCEVDGAGKTQTLDQQIDARVWIDGGPKQSLQVGDRVFTVSSSHSSLMVAVTEKENVKTGPATFIGSYKEFAGKNGFTGNITIIGDENRVLTFSCYSLAP